MTLLASLQELLAPPVVEVGMNPSAAAQRDNAVFTTQAFQKEGDLFFCGILLTSFTANLPNGRFCTALLCHNTLLWVEFYPGVSSHFQPFFPIRSDVKHDKKRCDSLNLHD
jgi:hypothetical protein